MNAQTLKIGIVAPGSPLKEEAAERVVALARSLFPEQTPTLLFHPRLLHRLAAGGAETERPTEADSRRRRAPGKLAAPKRGSLARKNFPLVAPESSC